MQRQQGFEQVHVRVLLAVAGADGDGVLEAAMRGDPHGGEDPAERSAGPRERRVGAGGAGIPGEAEQHEGVVVEVGGGIDDAAAGAEQLGPAALAAPAMRDHEVVGDAGGVQAAGPAHDRGVGVGVELTGLDAHALERAVGGDAVEAQGLVEAEPRDVAALAGPERQRLVEHPVAEPGRGRRQRR